MLSIVIPVCNEQDNVARLYHRIVKAVPDHLPFEVIFVDDGSEDSTFQMLGGLCAESGNVRCLRLSRNFGHQAALTAGLEYAKGDVVISMDGDLQHPPEIIPSMVKLWEGGADIVQVLRKDSSREGLIKTVTSQWYYRIARFMGIHLPNNASDYRLMSRIALDALLSCKENVRFVRGLVFWIGYNTAYIEVEMPLRDRGKTKYGFMAMLRFAGASMVGFSTFPLRLFSYFGITCLFLSAGYFLYAVAKYLEGESVRGWTSIIMLELIILSVQLISIGILGEYISAIFSEVKRRPVYLIKETISSRDRIA